jgi:hypothetical protein
MTDRIEEDDPRYTAILRYWRENGKPGVCQMADGNYMMLKDNGKIVFIQQAITDPYGTTSMGKLNK